MTWELASFVSLAAVLIAGFAWYEGSRPPSQIVALVAAMAALAVAGRVALAPVPNVVATTDIVIFTGFAIGAAPGFAVGALAGVVSNFWLGQGPWTPWQMAGWGLAGILGAVLCRALKGNPNRYVLAATCGLAGLAFGALMNFSLMASYGGELTLDRFLALEARAVPFDPAHAIGNVTLALVAGPAMVRMLVRFRERFEWRRAPRAGAAARPAATVVAMLLLTLALASPAQGAEIGKAVTWLKSAQNPNGGFPDTPGEASSVEMTGWAMLGLEAAGTNPLDVTKGKSDNNPVSYLRKRVAQISTTGDLARTTLALTAAGVDVQHFEGHNLLTELRNRMRKNGSWQGWPNLTAFSVLALRGGSSPRGLEHSLDWLRSVQGRDGGWGDVARSPSNADSTGAILQTLPKGSVAMARAVTYLRKHQLKGGGYRLGDSGSVNSQSTAWAVQGLTAAGLDPDDTRRGGSSGLEYLDRRQAGDGHFRYSRTSDVTPVWVTGQVLVAVSRKTFPLEVVPRAPQPDPADTSTPDTSTYNPDYSSALPGLNQFGSSPAPIIPDIPATDNSPSPSNPVPPKNKSPSIGPVAPVSKGGVKGEAESTLAKGSPAAFEMGPADGPAPLPPIAIGIGTGIVALVGTWFIGRRRVW